MSKLAELQSTLTQALRETLLVSSSFEDLKAVKNLQKINQELDGASSAPPSTSIAQTVTAFRRSQKADSIRQLKYVCYGAAMQMQDGWCVLGDIELLNRLLADVDRQNEERKRFKCFQALLSSYFAFSRYDEQTSKAAHTGWEILRNWLKQNQGELQRAGKNGSLRLPGWFATLAKHENLLTNKPCDRYGEDMLRGDNSSIEEARQGLGIPGDSWVMQEAILSQMRAAVALGDDPFKTRLDALLKLVKGQTEVKVSDLLKRHAIALLISRYARCASKPEQPALRDAAVSIIGNPWLKRTAWDAWVKNANDQPDDEAREMVNGWLKRRLITDFFDVLSEDGWTDQRRLNYWLRFESAIEDLWLALGPEAMRNMSKPYQDLRERSVGRLLSLENSGPSNNNAFIMRMGDWLIVEFGITGNACYVYPLTPSPFVLQGKKSVSLYKLKNKTLGKSYNHVASGWESIFDQAICPKVGYRPQGVIPPRVAQQGVNSDSHNLSYVEQYVKKFSLQTEDLRSSGRAFWVYAKRGDYPEVDRNLESWKFKYRQGRGWYRE